MNNQNKPGIRYANCWEDTKILLRALRIQPGEAGISIASGGDNTFALLLGNPSRIYAFDRNPVQLWLCALKMAAMQSLEYHELLSFLGVCRGDRIALYHQVRGMLPYDARRYFDENSEIIRSGILHAGKFEHFFGIFRRQIIPLFSTKRIFREFAAMHDPAAQQQFFEEHILNRRLRMMFRIYFGYRVMGRLGRDKSCYDYVDDKQQSGDDLCQRFAQGIARTSNNTNPYMQYIVNGRFTPHARPLYLYRPCYEIIRRRLDRIQLVQSDLLSLSARDIDFANLSDIFEYMSDREFEHNAAALAEMLRPAGRTAYWNMQNRRYLPQNAFEADAAAPTLFKQNQSWFYRDFLLYRRKDHEQDRTGI